MSGGIAVDNDILIKLACYELLCELLTVGQRRFHVLGAARFVAHQRIHSDGKAPDKTAALEALNEFLEAAVTVEPTDSEVALATHIETLAADLGLELDSGESLLSAILMQREFRLLLTGDKRAITALERIGNTTCINEALEGSVVCLEQVIMTLVGSVGAQVVRAQVCKAPRADRALSLSFSCANANAVVFTDEGLRSYIDTLRSRAPRLLHPSYAPL